MPMVDARLWPESRSTIWIACDSICRQLFISLACQLVEILEPGVFHITPGIEITDSHRCVHFKGGGRMCLYYLGCFTGNCFLPICPMLRKNAKKKVTCMAEFVNLVQPGDSVFIGLGVHMHEDEEAQTIKEMELFKQMSPLLMEKAKVHWLTTSSQHFASKSGRWMNWGEKKMKKILALGCKPNNYSLGMGVVNTISKQYIAELGVPIIPLYDMTQPYSHLHLMNKKMRARGGVDCTHFCNPGLPDVWGDVVFAHLRQWDNRTRFDI